MAVEVTPQVPGVNLPADANKRATRILDDAESWGQQLHSIWVRLLKREKAAILAKVGGSKAREGTKFWDGGEGYLATKAYDPKKWIDKSRWLGELEGETKELLVRFFRAYFKRAGMKDDMARKLADKLTNEQVDGALEYHGAYLDRLGELARTVAERPNSTIDDVVKAVTISFDDAIANSESVAVSNMIGSQNQAQLELVTASGLKGQKVWFCLAADTPVQAVNVTYAARRWFEGEMVELRLAGAAGRLGDPAQLDRHLTVTPNHPVLTGRGWIDAGQLHEGDYLVRHAGLQVMAAGDPDVEDRPPTIRQVFKAAAETATLGTQRMMGVPVQFDGYRFDGEVDVVRTGRDLPPDLDPTSGQPGGDEVFALTDEQLAGLVQAGAPSLHLVGNRAPEVSGTRGGDPALLHVIRGPGGTNETRGGTVATLDPEPVEGLGDRDRGYPVERGEDGQRVASQVAFDEVVGIRRIPFAGHVYDLSTPTHWFLANGYVVHNSAMDHRVRPHHRKPTHGQRRDFDKPFDVDGDPMQYPGDRSAPIGKWINCRCVLLFYPTVGGGGDGEGDALSGQEAAAQWMGLQADLSDWIETKALHLRHVRTPSGQDLFDQPIGTIIRPDVIPGGPRIRIARPLPPIRDFSAWGERGKEIEDLASRIDRAALTPPFDTSYHVPDETRKALTEIFHYHDPQTGLTQDPFQIANLGPGRWRVVGNIHTEDGQDAGTFEKTIDMGTDPPGAFHGLLQLWDKHQGQGFGERLLRHEENAYVAAGVDHIDLLAGLTVGGYAWARAGFDWHHSPGAFRPPWYKVLRAMRMADAAYPQKQGYASSLMDQEDHAQLKELIARFQKAEEAGDVGSVPTPWEISELGDRHVGKDILAGTEWEARKMLVPPRGVKDWQLERARWLATRAEEWWQECEARGWQLGDDGLDWAPGIEEQATKTVWYGLDGGMETKLAVRHVRTPEGRDLYDQEIGAVIRPDILPGHLPHLRTLPPITYESIDAAYSAPKMDITIDGEPISIGWHLQTGTGNRIKVNHGSMTAQYPEDRLDNYGRQMRKHHHRIIAEFTHQIDPAERIAYWDEIGVSYAFQGRGVADQWLKQLEDSYRDIGIREVRLEAGYNVGGYAWARAGFDWWIEGWDQWGAPWDHNDEPRSIRARIRNLLEGKPFENPEPWQPPAEPRPVTDRERAWLEHMAAQLDRAKEARDETIAPTPHELASFADGDAEDKLGKRLMLGTVWTGRKPLLNEGQKTDEEGVDQETRGVDQETRRAARARYLTAAADQWWEEITARLAAGEILGDDGLDWESPPEEQQKSDRHVRSPEGSRRYHLPIGSRIVVDWNKPDVDITGRGSLAAGGSFAEPPADEERIRHANVAARDVQFAALLGDGAHFEGETDPARMASRISLAWRRAALSYESEDTTIANALRIAATNTLDVPGGDRTGERVKSAAKYYADNKAVLDAFAEAQYQTTQGYLKQEGIEVIAGFRGANFDDEDPDTPDLPDYLKKADGKDGWVKVDPPDGALTSHSTSFKEAAKFGDATGGKSVILRSAIPADEVFGMYRTGLGMYGEDEVVTRGKVEAEAKLYDPRQLDDIWDADKEGDVTRQFLKQESGGYETKLDRPRKVRTLEGSRYYKLPIGSPIVPHTRLPKDAPARVAKAAVITPEQDRSLDALRQHPVNVKLGQAFRDQGHQLYLVGGSVRDAMAGHPDFADLDYTTDATPEDIKRIVDGLGSTWGMGEAFGTIGLQIDGLKTEITTFRKEQYEEGSRNPIVAFGDNIEEDLARRDLTMNSMALVIAPGGGHRVGDLVDPHDGAKDLDQGVLRTPDDPVKSMTEDPLRQLRVVRFAAKRSAKVDPALADAIRANKARLSIIPAERKTEELRKVLAGGRDTTFRAIKVAGELGLLQDMFGGLVKDGEAELVHNRVAYLDTHNPTAILAVLAARSIENGDDPQQIMTRMKMSNEETRPAMTAARIVLQLQTMNAGDEIGLRRIVRDTDPDVLKAALSATIQSGMAASRLRGIRGTALETRLRGPLPIDGRDLIAEGLQGPEIGVALERVKEAFLGYPTMTREEALALALGREVAKRPGEDVGTNWADALERAVDDPRKAPSPRYWLTTDGKWVPVAWHEDVFPHGDIYGDFVTKTQAVRVTMAPREATINPMLRPMTSAQIQALSRIRRPTVLIATSLQGRAEIFEQRLQNPDEEILRLTLEAASRYLRGGQVVPSRLAQFKRWERYLEKKVAVRHVRTPEGRELYDQEIGDIIRPDLPGFGLHLIGDASKVVDHQSDTDRSTNLFNLWGKGLPHFSALGPRRGTPDGLRDERNRQAAKAEVAQKIWARLDDDTKRQLARQAAENEVGRIRNMLEGMNETTPIAVPVEARDRVMAQLSDPFHPDVIWRRRTDYDPNGPNVWQAPWYENIIAMTGIADPEAGTRTSQEEEYRRNNYEYMKGNDPRLIDALGVDAVSDFIAGWASTSNDNNPKMLAAQEAIREEFGLPDTMEWHWENPASDHADREWAATLQRQHDAEVAKIPLYRKLVRAQYDETQQWLADNGVTEMLVYRGMQWKEREGERPPEWFDQALTMPEVEVVGPQREIVPERTQRLTSGRVVVVSSAVYAQDSTMVPPTIPVPPLRPASSWAYGSRMASAFAGLGDTHNKPSRDHNGARIATVVPAAAILATPRTGFGSLPEEEVVVLAFSGDVQVEAVGEGRKAVREGRAHENLSPSDVRGIRESVDRHPANVPGWYQQVFMTDDTPDEETMRRRLRNVLAMHSQAPELVEPDPPDPAEAVFANLNLPATEMAGLTQALQLYDDGKVNVNVLQGWYQDLFGVPNYEVYNLDDDVVVARLREALRRAGGGG